MNDNLNHVCEEIYDILFTPKYLKIKKECKNMSLTELKKIYPIVKDELQRELLEYKRLDKLYQTSPFSDKFDIDYKRMQVADKCKSLMAKERIIDDIIFKREM